MRIRYDYDDDHCAKSWLDSFSAFKSIWINYDTWFDWKNFFKNDDDGFALNIPRTHTHTQIDLSIHSQQVSQPNLLIVFVILTGYWQWRQRHNNDDNDDGT